MEGKSSHLLLCDHPWMFVYASQEEREAAYVDMEKATEEKDAGNTGELCGHACGHARALLCILLVYLLSTHMRVCKQS
jgi:hypothetical protein